jgi:nucleoporin NUP1
MQDDERVSRLGRKSHLKRDVHPVNDTKPYAGEGGMKKLLARRRMETEKCDQKQEYDEKDIEEGERAVENHTRDVPPTFNGTTDDLHPGLDSARSSSHSIPARKDWYTTASSSFTPTSVSSLRVGRTKTRAHIARPVARPMKTKFSAAYEDDDSMDDVEISQGESEQMEREMLDEAAKRAPIFKIPEGFSFAKEVCYQSTFFVTRAKY